MIYLSWFVWVLPNPPPNPRYQPLTRETPLIESNTTICIAQTDISNLHYRLHRVQNTHHKHTSQFIFSSRIKYRMHPPLSCMYYLLADLSLAWQSRTDSPSVSYHHHYRHSRQPNDITLFPFVPPSIPLRFLLYLFHFPLVFLWAVGKSSVSWLSR